MPSFWGLACAIDRPAQPGGKKNSARSVFWASEFRAGTRRSLEAPYADAVRRTKPMESFGGDLGAPQQPFIEEQPLKMGRYPSSEGLGPVNLLSFKWRNRSVVRLPSSGGMLLVTKWSSGLIAQFAVSPTSHHSPYPLHSVPGIAKPSTSRGSVFHPEAFTQPSPLVLV